MILVLFEVTIKNSTFAEPKSAQYLRNSNVKAIK